MEKYLDILEESLQKKSRILDTIQEINQKQLKLFEEEELSLEQYDEYVDEKAECIDKLTMLDNGFENLYQGIRKELESSSHQYREKILCLQELIKEVTDKSVSVQATEARNKKKVEEYFRATKKDIQTARLSSKAAMGYYQSMNKMNYVEAQFMDRKK